MKIISGKNWEKYQQQMVDLQMDLNDCIEQNHLLEGQVQVFRTTNMEQANLIEKFEYDIKDLQNETKRLKTLLTKNKISYKKEEKKNEPRKKVLQEK